MLEMQYTKVKCKVQRNAKCKSRGVFFAILCSAPNFLPKLHFFVKRPFFFFDDIFTTSLESIILQLGTKPCLIGAISSNLCKTLIKKTKLCFLKTESIS